MPMASLLSATAAEASSVDAIVVIIVVVSAIILVAMIPTAAPPRLDLIVVASSPFCMADCCVGVGLMGRACC